METGKTTIDSNDLLKNAVLHLKQREQNELEMPMHLAASHIPTTEVLNPSRIKPDPLRLTKLYPHSVAFFNPPDTSSPFIFGLNVAPSIGDTEEIETCEKKINQAKSTSAKEKKILLTLLKTLKETEADFQLIQGRLKEFVLG